MKKMKSHQKFGIMPWLACLAMVLGSAFAPALHGADDPSAAAGKYRETIKGEPGLLGYWVLEKDLRAEAGLLKLGSSKPAVATTTGPFGASCVDLSDGNDLVIEPGKDLDGARMSVELMFRIVKSSAGNPCLFAIRGKDGVRFSLHFNPGSGNLLLWNGGSVTNYQANDVLVENEWFHIALSFGDDSTRLWLNGKLCKSAGNKGSVATRNGLPFVLGSSSPASGPEHAGIAVAHLAIYQRPLGGDEVIRHVTAAGWTGKLRERLVWQDCPVSILESQIGYHPRNLKRVYLRSAVENPPQEFLPSDFSVHDAKTGKEVFRGAVQKWGAKWESFWWVLDFTPLRLTGEYEVHAGRLVSSAFKIEDGVFHKTDLDVIALDQLEHRIHHGLEDKRKGLAGKYMHAPPGIRIYMDCGSPYAELEPVGTCVYALFDLHDLLGREFPEKDRKRMIDLAAMGADYFVAAQRHTDDPETDGMFHHSLLVNTKDTWAGEIFTYLDTAYGMALLAKAHQFFKERDPERAARYLKAAEKAWKLCTHRPHHTEADRTLPKGCNAYFWNAPQGIQDTFGRCFYDIPDEKWTLPRTLRTRDRLPFVKGSALLYEITGRREYLDQAVRFADAIMERQFTDWQNPIEGCFGNFYEFEGDNRSFFHEFMQGGFWWEGNVESLNLDGFMHLLRLAPAHPKAAAWQNTILVYAGNYARRATTLNPLGIYPAACYQNKEHGGIRNFQNMLMGSSCLYGFSAKNFMVLGDFLQDAGFQSNAIAGVNFIAGLNPGVPNAFKDTAWDARTLIQGVGRSWFGPAGDLAETARGSVSNGFCASPQFWLPNFTSFVADHPDKPAGLINQGGGLQFNEGWILHSHAYVHGVARLEAAHTLKLKTARNGAGVPAGVSIVLKECVAPHIDHKREYQTGADGTLTLTDLPTPCNGTLHITHQGGVITRPLAAIAGGNHVINVDFAREVNMEIKVPENLAAGAKGDAVISIGNAGSGKVALKIAISGGGVIMETPGISVTLEPGETKKMTVGFTGGERVTPYLVRAVIVEGAPEREFHATGRIHPPAAGSVNPGNP
jgi:hypothetical protein